MENAHPACRSIFLPLGGGLRSVWNSEVWAPLGCVGADCFLNWLYMNELDYFEIN